MQLSAVFLAAFGPVLALGQPQQLYTPSLATAADPAMNGIVHRQNRIGKRCLKTPMTPQIFFAERRFFSFLNTIVFTDTKGQEFGYVQSWFMDWQNPFGYTGASFYMRVPEPEENRTGAYTLDPDRSRMSFESAQELGPMPDPSAMTDEEVKIWQDKMDWDFRNGIAADSDGYWQIGSMRGPHDGKTLLVNQSWAKIALGHPQKDQMHILDCHGTPKYQAENGKLTRGNSLAEDATYYMDQSGTANQLIFQDLSIPKEGIVELIMKEPCTPFPPFCAGMGPAGWFLYGRRWEGRITEKGYNFQTGIKELRETIGGGVASDMTFVTLYSSYQFSNTRWSPFMFLVWNGLVVLLVACCIRQCCCTQARGVQLKKAEEKGIWKQTDEETQKLMTTKEIEAFESRTPQKSAGFWGSCCRAPGNAKVVSNTMYPGPGTAPAHAME